MGAVGPTQILVSSTAASGCSTSRATPVRPRRHRLRLLGTRCATAWSRPTPGWSTTASPSAGSSPAINTENTEQPGHARRQRRARRSPHEPASRSSSSTRPDPPPWAAALRRLPAAGRRCERDLHRRQRIHQQQRPFSGTNRLRDPEVERALSARADRRDRLSEPSTAPLDRARTARSRRPTWIRTSPRATSSGPTTARSADSTSCASPTRAGPLASTTTPMMITIPDDRAQPLPVPAQGTTGGLDALDDRLFEAMIAEGPDGSDNALDGPQHPGQLERGGEARAAIATPSRWYQLGNLDTIRRPWSSRARSSTRPLPTRASSGCPSIAMNGQGHASLNTSTAGIGRRAEVASSGRLCERSARARPRPSTSIQSSNTATTSDRPLPAAGATTRRRSSIPPTTRPSGRSRSTPRPRTSGASGSSS